MTTRRTATREMFLFILFLISGLIASFASFVEEMSTSTQTANPFYRCKGTTISAASIVFTHFCDKNVKKKHI